MLPNTTTPRRQRSPLLKKIPLKLTESAKLRRAERKNRKIEKLIQLPDHIKHATIDFHYRTGKDAAEIVKTGIGQRMVYPVIKRLKETGSVAPRPRSGRPATAVASVNIKRVRRVVYRNPETSMADIARKVGISEGSVAKIVLLNARSYRMGRGQLLNDRQVRYPAITGSEFTLMRCNVSEGEPAREVKKAAGVHQRKRTS